MTELTFDPANVPSTAWQTILSTETDTDVHSIEVALYTDTVFSTWADANSGEALASEYSDSVIAMECTITKYDGTDYIATQTDLNQVYCLFGEKEAFGGTIDSGDFLGLHYTLGADVTAPAVGDSLGSIDPSNYAQGFTLLSVDSSTIDEFNTSW